MVASSAAPRAPKGSTNKTLAHSSTQMSWGTGEGMPAPVSASRSRSTRSDAWLSHSATESEPGPPVLMMTYNPAYYLDLAAAAGLAKEKDLVALLAPVDDREGARR